MHPFCLCGDSPVRGPMCGTCDLGVHATESGCRCRIQDGLDGLRVGQASSALRLSADRNAQRPVRRAGCRQLDDECTDLVLPLPTGEATVFTVHGGRLSAAASSIVIASGSEGFVVVPNASDLAN